jgi:hypothetical protein
MLSHDPPGLKATHFGSYGVMQDGLFPPYALRFFFSAAPGRVKYGRRYWPV